MLVVTGGQDSAILAELGGPSPNNPSLVYSAVVAVMDVIAFMFRVPGRLLSNFHPSFQLILSTSHQAVTVIIAILLLGQLRLREVK